MANLLHLPITENLALSTIHTADMGNISHNVKIYHLMRINHCYSSLLLSVVVVCGKVYYLDWTLGLESLDWLLNEYVRLQSIVLILVPASPV